MEGELKSFHELVRELVSYFDTWSLRISQHIFCSSKQLIINKNFSMRLCFWWVFQLATQISPGIQLKKLSDKIFRFDIWPKPIANFPDFNVWCCSFDTFPSQLLHNGQSQRTSGCTQKPFVIDLKSNFISIFGWVVSCCWCSHSRLMEMQNKLFLTFSSTTKSECNEWSSVELERESLQIANWFWHRFEFRI